MVKLAGILLLVAGVALPAAMLLWLSQRLGRKPAPNARWAGLLIAFNGIFPIGLVMAGLTLLAPELGGLLWVRAVMFATLIAAGIIFALLLAAGRRL